MNADRRLPGLGATRVAGERFTTREIARLARLTRRQVRGFVEAGLLSPARGRRGRWEFGPLDLVRLRSVREIFAAGIGQRRIAAAAERAATDAPPGTNPARVRLRLVDGEIVASEGARTWHAESGQMFFGFRPRGRRAKVVPLGAAEEGDDDGAAYRAFTRGTALEAISPDEAKSAYREVLRLDAEAVPALVNLGRLEHESGELDAAERLYREALALDPGERTAAFNLAVLAEDRGDVVLAIRRWEVLLRIAPDAVEAHQRLAALHARRGDREAARHHTARGRRLLRGS